MKKFLIAATAAVSLAGTAAAAEDWWEPVAVHVDNGESDIGFGIGLSWALGAKSASTGLSVGVKAFSQKRTDSVAASVGLDYNFASGGFRPNLGLAYLLQDQYIDVNYGYNFADQAWGLGLATGYVETARDSVTYIERTLE